MTLLPLLLVDLGCVATRTEQTPSTPAPASASPGERVAPVARTKAPSPDPDALCCCTFSFAHPDDFGVAAAWDSLASTCPIGDADRMPGQCIDWKWCRYPQGQEPRTLADRPELAPKPPLPASSCCCDIFDGQGETFSVLPATTCAQTPDAHCVASEFCGVPSAKPSSSKKRR